MNRFKIIAVVLISFVLFTISRNIAFAQSKVQRVCSEDSVVCITAEEFGRGDSVVFYVENLSICEITVTLQLALENMVSSQPSPYTDVYPPRSRHRAFVIEVESREAGDWKYGSDYYYRFGNYHAIHDSNYVYGLPFLSGQKYKISQGYHDEFTHKDQDSCSVDFEMPIGTPICASRDGTVVRIIDKYDKGGNKIKFKDKVNGILLQHDDGTIGQYLHLKKSGSKVEIGQKVKRGQVIGFSGNSGYSLGPHLHFCVLRPVDGKTYETIPVCFDTVEGKGITLLRGQRYTAP